MEVWRPEVIEGRRPEVLSGRSLCIAVVIHVAAFAGLYLFACLHGLFNKEEEIIPIDLTVVVNENLDGKENEPPPLKKPDPPKPKPKPVPPKPKPKVKEPEKPKELEKIVTNVVTKVEKKKEEPKKETPKKEEPKKEEPKKPDPPKKTAKELRDERMKKMRESAKVVNKPVTIEVKNQPSGNGKTAKRTLSDAEVLALLNAGYKPGTSEQIATSELQLGYSLIKMAFDAKWEKPPWTDTLRPMVIRVWFGPGGKVLNYKLEQSSRDANADQTIKSAAARVGSVPGLPKAFIDKFKSSGVPIKFTVMPN